jgi:hypothetical protein
MHRQRPDLPAKDLPPLHSADLSSRTQKRAAILVVFPEMPATGSNSRLCAHGDSETPCTSADDPKPPEGDEQAERLAWRSEAGGSQAARAHGPDQAVLTASSARSARPAARKDRRARCSRSLPPRRARLERPRFHRCSGIEGRHPRLTPDIHFGIDGQAREALCCFVLRSSVRIAIVSLHRGDDARPRLSESGPRPAAP